MMLPVLAVALIAPHAKPAVISREESARHYFLGVAQLAEGNRLRAAWEFTHAVHFDPTNADAWLARARVFESWDQSEQAIADYSRVLRIRPNALAYFHRGYLLANRNDDRAAVADLTRALEFDPNLLPARRLRGGVSVRLGDNANALHDLNAALEFEPDDAAALTWRAVAHFGGGQHGLADADFACALRLDSNNSSAVYNRAVMNIQLGRELRVAADLDRLIALKPDDPEAYTLRAELHARSGDREIAVRDYTWLIARNPKSADLYRKRAAVHTADANHPAALTDLEKVAELVPKADSYRALAQFHLDCPDASLKNAEKAVEFADKAWTLDNLTAVAAGRQLDPRADELRATAAAAAGDLDRAVSILNGVQGNTRLTAADHERVKERLKFYQQMIGLKLAAAAGVPVSTQPSGEPKPTVPTQSLLTKIVKDTAPGSDGLPPIIIPVLPPDDQGKKE